MHVSSPHVGAPLSFPCAFCGWIKRGGNWIIKQHITTPHLPLSTGFFQSSSGNFTQPMTSSIFIMFRFSHKTISHKKKGFGTAQKLVWDKQGTSFNVMEQAVSLTHKMRHLLYGRWELHVSGSLVISSQQCQVTHTAFISVKLDMCWGRYAEPSLPVTS